MTDNNPCGVGFTCFLRQGGVSILWENRDGGLLRAFGEDTAAPCEWSVYHTHSFFHFSLCLLDSVSFSDETFTCIALYPRVWLNSWGLLKIDYSRTISLLFCRCYGPLVRWENPFSPVYKIQQYRESSARLQNILADYWQKN